MGKKDFANILGSRDYFSVLTFTVMKAVACLFSVGYFNVFISVFYIIVFLFLCKDIIDMIVA